MLTSDRDCRGGECGGDHETETETDDAKTTHQMKKIVPHPFQINTDYI
jgi:hypothetical protein